MTYTTPPYVPGPPPFPPAAAAPPPKKKRNALRWILTGVFSLIALFLAGSIIVAVNGGTKDKPAGAPITTENTQAAAPVVNDPTTSPVTMTVNDIKLTVHTTKKDCFGSAGCNVEYEIKAALSVHPTECQVTYDVHGLEDTQTGTLQFHADGTFEQDSYQAGETSSSSKKLTAKVTEVDCS